MPLGIYGWVLLVLGAVAVIGMVSCLYRKVPKVKVERTKSGKLPKFSLTGISLIFK